MSDVFGEGFGSWSYDEVMRHEGSDLDVRVVVAEIPQDVKDELRYDQIPWGRFSHAGGPAVNVPEDLERITSPDEETAGRALKRLWDGVLHQGDTYPPAALAAPFLLRLALPSAAHYRADILELVGGAARREHYRDGTRTGLLQVDDDRLRILSSGYLERWAIRAVRIAVTADVSLLLELLNDADARVRSGACYVLATALDGTELISLALRRRLDVEDVPAARMSLILALAQLAREHHDGTTAELLRQWWSAPDRPVDWRVSAAIAWLCLVDDPVPEDLRTLLTTQITDELAEQLGGVPWMEGVDWDGGGLRRCVYLMLNPEVVWWAVHGDPWAEPSK